MAGSGKHVGRWRALSRTAALAVGMVLGLVTMPAAHAAAVTATLSVGHAWQTGFIARFAISNSSTVQLNDWRLEFDLPPGESISHAWNSTVTQYGTHWVLTPANWNRNIAPGDSVTGGFRGVVTGSFSPPVNCQLNRQVLCT